MRVRRCQEKHDKQVREERVPWQAAAYCSVLQLMSGQHLMDGRHDCSRSPRQVAHVSDCEFDTSVSGAGFKKG